MKNTKTTSIIILLMLIIGIIFPIKITKAVTIGTDTYFIVGNENYSVNSGTMEFSQIVIDGTNIRFNDTFFNVSSGGAIIIKLIKIANNIKTTAAPGDVVLKFTGTATTGTTYFNISGFKNSYVYDIYKNNVFAYTRTTDTKGRVNFSQTSWSTITFEVREQTANNPPVISNEYPTTGATGIGLLTKTYVTITDVDLQATTVCFWNNKTGTWIKAQQNNSVASGTVVRDMSADYVTSYSTKYWWRVTAYDGIANTSATYSFATKANSVPVFTGENPANGSTGVSTSLASWNVTIREPNGETFDWTIQTTPYKGSNSGNAAANGSKATTLVTPLAASTAYKVWVNATDGIGWKRAWYLFTTAGAGNNPPSVTSPSPANNTYGVILPLSQFGITIADPEGNKMNITWRENTTIGSWRTFNTTTNQNNGTYYAKNTSWISSYSTRYWWRLVVNDGMGGWTNVTYYCFSTRNNSAPVFGTPFPANSSTGVDKSLGLLSINISDPNGDLMNVTLQNNKTGSWVTFGTLANKANGSYDVIVTWITNYSMKYWWKVFVNESYGGSGTAMYHFTTEANTPPVFSSVYPANNSLGISTGLYQFTVYISDDELFDWNITVSPSSYSNSGVNNFTGTKSCTLPSVAFSTLYTVNVDATDSLGLTTTGVFFFTTASATPGDGGGGGAPLVGTLKINIRGENADIRIYQGDLLRYVKSNVKKDTAYTLAGLTPGVYTVEVTGVMSGVVKKQNVEITTGGTKEITVNMAVSGIPGFEFLLVICSLVTIVLINHKRYRGVVKK